ncbi:MAG: hypothetical protein JRJ29_06050 [Deltaproteobacteria bacterium]|nr:hypothetical protein [Deltaproteobacteria bacterium]
MESAKPSEILLERVEKTEVSLPPEAVVLPRLFHHEALGKDLSSSETLDIQSLISTLNYIHFMEKPIFLQLAHPKYQDSILIEAHPEPCDGIELTCRWSRENLPDLDIQRYRFLNLILDDGKEIIIVPVVPRSITGKGFTVELSKRGQVAGKRKARRYACENIGVSLTQGGFMARGELLEFSPLAFRTRIRPGPYCSFHEYNSEGTFFLNLEREGKPLFSQACRVVRQGAGMAEREIVLTPLANSVNRFKKRNIRSPRILLNPPPTLAFKHPFFDRTFRLQTTDISLSGFSVHEKADCGVLVPGLIIPKMTIHFSGSAAMNCAAQVIYRHEAPGDMVRCGISILDMEMEDYARLSEILFDFLNSNSPVSTYVGEEELWEFFFKVGAVQPETYSILGQHKQNLKEGLPRGLLERPELGKHLAYKDNGQIIAYASLVKAYERAWLVFHRAGGGDLRQGAVLNLLEQLMIYLHDMHRLPFSRSNFAIHFYQKGDEISEKLHEAFARMCGNPKVCSVDRFSLIMFKKNMGEGSLPRGWSMKECSWMDYWELNRFYDRISGGLFMGALSLDSEERAKVARDPSFDLPAPSLVTRTYSLRHEGELCAVIIAPSAGQAMELFQPWNSIKVIVMVPSLLPRDILFKALAQVSNFHEGLDQVQIMVHPPDYLKENGVAEEKEYKLWVLNLSHMETYLEHLRELKMVQRSPGPSEHGSASLSDDHRGNGAEMKAVGTLAAGLAHNFNNLLMGIQGHTSLLLMDTDPSDPRHEHIRGIEHCVRNASTLTTQLLGFAGGGKYNVQPTNLNTLIEKSVLQFRKTAKNLQIRTIYEEEVWTVDVDRDQMMDTLLNLFKNARDAMPNGGTLYLGTKNVVLDRSSDLPPDLPTGKYVKVVVRDSGVGMDRETQEKCFAPFFTTKGIGNALGMGLAYAYGVVKNHRGFIKVESRIKKGSAFALYLPSTTMRA